MEFHIARSIREQLNYRDLLFSYTGNVIFANVTACRGFAQQLQALHEREGRGQDVVNAGTLFAMGLLDELSHAMIARYRTSLDPAIFTEALDWLRQESSTEAADALLQRFTEEFPNTEVFSGKITAEEWLSQSTEDLPHREAALEELLLLWLANINPAYAPYRELFSDTGLRQDTDYERWTESLGGFFENRPRIGAETLLEVLRAPMLAAPDSIAAQLDYVRQHWAEYLGEDLRRTLLAIDVLREEEIAIWMRFHPPTPGRHQRGDAAGWAAEGFEGDEYIGFDGVRRRGSSRRYASDYQAELNEYEAFSPDQAWMPNVVLMAKSTYVWLEQLSKKYGRHIHRLDQIPDEELQLLADRGMTALWLIGLWERSVASRTIKRLRGQEDSVASAYSLKSYDIADDLGGNAAYESLRDRAARYGLRLASDMVPNHMGIDSNWVLEHPDWFISRPESPFPSYSFNGPDLSTDSRVEIKLDDHYYDQTDAAVVFRLREHSSGSTRFIYHGNDGTTFAWNDTAQLDYSKAYVREQVMQAILHVARLFPIIRFDAAMVLAKRHVQRLWFPLPGVGGSIPSRAESAMSQEEFDSIMPAEFWREVVDRVAQEVPGTLLLAEAFWMLEGYFVRTLGMHRVYNSAFMNMLRDEENAKYRSYLKKTMEFDPDILKRYVNFMSNPDERTAIDQFGSGDKFFGTCVLMATLPGLPMFGHGQIEGYTERYGMEYKRARMDEWPNEYLVSRHEREIAPLLKRRWEFAESANFVLYDFWNEHGTVDENVFAYSNRNGEARSLVFYNNVYGSTRGTVHVSAAAMEKETGGLRQRRLREALAVSDADGAVIALQDSITGLQYLRRGRSLEEHGFFLELRGYQYAVFQNIRELQSTAEQPWDRLCDALHGNGVYSLDEALATLRLQPLHDALRSALSSQFLELFSESARPSPAAAANAGEGATGGDVVLAEEALQPWHAAYRLAEEILGTNPETGREQTDQQESFASALAQAQTLLTTERSFSTAWPVEVREVLPNEQSGAIDARQWAPIVAYLWTRSLAAEPDAALSSFDRLQLRQAFATAFAGLGLEGEAAWRAAARVRTLLLAEAQPDAVWVDGDVRWLVGAHEADGTTWFSKEGFATVACWLQLPELLQAADAHSLEAIEADLQHLLTAAEQSGFDFARLQAGLRSPVEKLAADADAPAESVAVDPEGDGSGAPKAEAAPVR